MGPSAGFGRLSGPLDCIRSRKADNKETPSLRMVIDPYRAPVSCCDFPNKSKPKSDTPVAAFPVR